MNLGAEEGLEKVSDEISDEVEKKLKEKLEQEGVDFAVKETSSSHIPSGIGQDIARPPRRGARPPHADQRKPSQAAPPPARQAGLSPELAEPEGEEEQEVPETETPDKTETVAPASPAGNSGEADAPENQQTPAGGLGGAPEAAAPARGVSSPSRRYEPTVAAPTKDQAAGTPTEQPGVSPTAPSETGQPAQGGEQKPEEEKPGKTPGEAGAGEKEANPEETGEKPGEPGEKSAEGQEGTEKPYQQFTEPEPGRPADEAGAQTEDGLGPTRKKTEAGENQAPDARAADQEGQRQQAADLARQRQQTRQEQKQKKTDEEERKGKTTTSGASAGFRDLQGIVLLGAFRDVFILTLGWIPFIGGVILGFFLLLFALPLIFFIKKQDKKRLALLVAKEIAPKWEVYGIAFLASHALTLIYLDRKYKSGGLIPGVGAVAPGATKS